MNMLSTEEKHAIIAEIDNYVKELPTSMRITKLGEGGQGSVYRVNDYVVKRMALLYPSHTNVFVKEIEAYEKLNENVKFRSYMPTYRGSDIVKRQLRPGEYTSLRPDIRDSYLSAWGDGYLFQNYERVDDLYSIIIDPTRKFTSKVGLNMINELQNGLQILHEAGYIHRDIKLENIIVRKLDNHPILIDFGLICKLPCEVEITNCGTPNYFPPNVLPKSARKFQTRKFKVQQFGFVNWIKYMTGCKPPRKSAVSVKTTRELARIQASPAQDRFALSIVISQIIRKTNWEPKDPKLDEALAIYYKMKHAIIPQIAANIASRRRLGTVRKSRKN